MSDNKALTLEQLRKMDGKPVYWKNTDLWCLAGAGKIILPTGISYPVRDMPGQFYAYPPAHIDREAWEPCYACKNCGNCEEAGKATGEKINYSHPCHSCVNGDNFKPVAFCRVCGRPLTDEAWVELEKRLRG